MDFSQLKEETKSIGFQEIRADRSDYFEAVLAKEKTADLAQKLKSIFGAPQWPSAKRLSASISGVISNFGGVRDGQVLYFRQEKDCALFAMLWPWRDGGHITLKMGQRIEPVKKKGS